MCKLRIGCYSTKGRNFSGRICVFHRGSGNVFKYRVIDLYRRLNLFGFIYKILYDPNRTAFLGLVLYENGLFSFIILSQGLDIGSRIFSGYSLNKKLDFGYSVPLEQINIFSIINNIEIMPYKGFSLCRSAGSSAIVVSKEDSKVSLKLKSGWLLSISNQCMASLGYTSNILHNSLVIGKAGFNRNLGIRPTVRGVAMNPCDHPHGGGNGKTSTPRLPVNKYGKPAKWVHTTLKKEQKLKRSLYKKIR